MSSLWSIKMRFLICLLAVGGFLVLGGCSTRHNEQETKQVKVVVAPAREGEVFVDVRGDAYRLPGPGESKAAVLSPSGELLYRGRIDDRYFDYGKQRSQPTHQARDALAQP